MTSSQQKMINFNGKSMPLDKLMTISQFIEYEQIPGSRFIVVINDEIVPKTQWDSTELGAGDKVDIVSPISGG